LNYGDIVKISVAATNFDKLGFDLFYKLEVIHNEEPILAGRAKTGMLCYDYVQKKKVSVPNEVLKKLSA
jgi:acyl-CoA thioesterase FadM